MDQHFRADLDEIAATASDWQSIGAEAGQIGRCVASVQRMLPAATAVDLGAATHMPMLAGNMVIAVLGELRRATDHLGSAAESAGQLSADLGTDAQKLLAVAAKYAEVDSAVRTQLESVLDRGGSKSGLDIEHKTKGGGASAILSALSGLDGLADEPTPSAAPKPRPTTPPKRKPHPPAAPRHGAHGHRGTGGGHSGGAHGGSGHPGRRGGAKPGGKAPHVTRPGSGGNNSRKHRSGGNGKGRHGGGHSHAIQSGGSYDPPGPPYYANQPQILRWIGEAFAVLEAHQIPASELDVRDVLLIIEHESGGNPNAINRTDINAQNGDPSRGLMQTISTTFNAYALPGHNGSIYDPVDNIIAGCRYAIDRYGSLAAVPGVRAVKAGRPYVGY